MAARPLARRPRSRARPRRLLHGSRLSQNRPMDPREPAKESQRCSRYRDEQMNTMDSQTVEKLIRDVGLPGRLVEVKGRLIVVDLLDDRSERFMRHEMGLSEFCDLLLDWRQKMIDRAIAASAERVRSS